MKKVKMRVDNDTEMMEIYTEGVRIFSGNFWDFDRPKVIEKLIKLLGIELEVEEYSYE